MLDVVGANILSYRYNNWQQDCQRVKIAAMIPTDPYIVFIQAAGSVKTLVLSNNGNQGCHSMGGR